MLAKTMVTLLAVTVLLLSSARAAPVCRGAGLAGDAPLFYLIALPNGPDGVPEPPLERHRQAKRRISLEAVHGQDDASVFFVSLADRSVWFPYHGFFYGLFREADLNDDGIPDVMVYEPAGAFYAIYLYAGCGDGFFTPVGEFDSRELPEPDERVRVRGVLWAEFEVIAPDRTRLHSEPLVNWAKRRWQFDGKGYRQVSAEALHRGGG